MEYATEEQRFIIRFLSVGIQNNEICEWMKRFKGGCVSAINNARSARILTVMYVKAEEHINQNTQDNRRISIDETAYEIIIIHG
jgi:hypothetical protein